MEKLISYGESKGRSTLGNVRLFLALMFQFVPRFIKSPGVRKGRKLVLVLASLITYINDNITTLYVYICIHHAF